MIEIGGDGMLSLEVAGDKDRYCPPQDPMCCVLFCGPLREE